MTPQLAAAAMHLVDMLIEENTALRSLDLRRAGSFAERKARAIDAFTAAQALVAHHTSGLSVAARKDAEALAQRLGQLARENRELLERAIGVQRRVIGVVARAVPRAMAQQQATRYGANGSATPARTPAPIALSARA